MNLNKTDTENPLETDLAIPTETIQEEVLPLQKKFLRWHFKYQLIVVILFVILIVLVKSLTKS